MTPPKTKLKPRSEDEEIWELQIDGTVYLTVTTHNRFGQPMDSDLQLGPGKRGHQFRITSFDRVTNQEKCSKVELDPFRNGMLVRCDVDQGEDEDTASDQAVSTTDLVLMLELHGAAFENTVRGLNEHNLRRLLTLGEEADASHNQIEHLKELIQERHGVARSQDLEKAESLR